MIYDIKVAEVYDDISYISFCERTPSNIPKVIASQHRKQETQRRMTKELWVKGRYQYTHITGLSDNDLETLSKSINNYLKSKKDAKKTKSKTPKS